MTSKALISYLLVVVVIGTTYAQSKAVISRQQRPGKNHAKHCNVVLFRIIGRQNRYVLACFCTTRGVTSAVARVQTDDFSSRKISLRQDRANIRCILDEEDILTHACMKSRKEFNRVGNGVLHQCQDAAPMPGDKKIDDPQEFKRDECVVTFPSLQADQIGAVVGCVCRNERYQVVSGRAQFFTNAAPTDPGAEVPILLSCVSTVMKQLEDVCRDSPGDFEILSLQLLEVCCKRARVASGAKFQCAAAVPNDLSALKVPFRN